MQESIRCLRKLGCGPRLEGYNARLMVDGLNTSS
jgi:hypothetical protein